MARRPSLSLDEHLEAPYEIALVRRDGGDGRPWTAHVAELPGCEVRAESQEQALSLVREAMATWIGETLAAGRAVPPPRAATTHSGRLLVRMPPALHASLARLADRQRVSLNALVTGILGEAVERPTAPLSPSATTQEPATQEGAPPRGRDRTRLLSVALVVNLAAVVVAGLVATVLLGLALVH